MWLFFIIHYHSITRKKEIYSGYMGSEGRKKGRGKLHWESEVLVIYFFFVCLFVFFVLSSLSIFKIIAKNALLGRLLIYNSISSCSGIFFFPCSSISNIFLCHLFCLICFHFYVSGKLFTFSYLREMALCRIHAMGLSSMLPSCHQSYMLLE